jgi:hypothetical protein
MGAKIGPHRGTQPFALRSTRSGNQPSQKSGLAKGGQAKGSGQINLPHVSPPAGLPRSAQQPLYPWHSDPPGLNPLSTAAGYPWRFDMEPAAPSK